MGLVGGTGLYISGNENGGYLTSTYMTDFKAAPEIGFASLFFREETSNFGALTPHEEIVVTGNMILSAVPGIEYVGYLVNGGSVTISLSETTASFDARWYNPRTGVFQNFGSVIGGGDTNFDAPSTEDWVLHLYVAGNSEQMPTPQNIGVTKN